jgi:cytochrome c-type biogenesis protein CcmH/NrfG/mono/diheme cytochrome c family protein
MARRKQDRGNRYAAGPATAEGPGSGAIAPWVIWGGVAIAFLLAGFGLGLLVTRWGSLTPAPGPGPAAPEETRALNPGDPTGVGQSLEAAARIADLKARLALNPHETSTRLALAHLYLDAARFAEAIPLYQEVLRQEPENPDALMHMGAVLLRGGHGKEALRYLDHALKTDPNNAHALWDKAQVQATLLEDYASALRTWEQFLKVAPGPEDAARVREMMAEARSRMEGRPTARASVPSPAPGRQADASVAPRTAASRQGSPAPGDPTVQAARELLSRIGAGPSSGSTAGTPGAPDPAAGAMSAAAHPGERLFWEKGCGGCHAIRGVGGLTAPDLARRARKGGRDAAWHVRFLKEPATVLPGTRMPSYRHLSDRELRTLAEFLVTL